MDQNDKNKSNKNNDRRRGVLSLLIWALVLTIGFNYLLSAMDTKKLAESTCEIRYDEFLDLVRNGKVKEVEIADRTLNITPVDGFTYTDADGKTYSGDFQLFTTQINDPELRSFLDENGVEFGKPYKAETSYLEIIMLNYVLPTALMVGAFILMMRFISKKTGGGGFGGLGSVGKSNAKVYMEKSTGVTFADVAGQDEAKESLVEIIDFLHNPQKYTDIGAKLPRGALLVGPPGTGKTLLAKAVAGEANVPFFSISGSGCVEMFVGVGASRVRDLFAEASKVAPCIIFIDEIDAIGKTRDTRFGGNDEREQTLNQLLAEMDGFDPGKGIIVLAATNRPEVLDQALLRPGRFDRQITVGYPDVRGREAILRVHAKDKPLADDVDLANIAKRTPYFAGADLENIMNEAAILCAREGKERITARHLNDAIERVQMGPEKKSHVVTEKDKRLVACHEAGHAIVGELLPGCDEVHLVTIMPLGGSGGHTLLLPDQESDYTTRSQLLDYVAMALGGYAAESIVMGEVSTGAGSDLQRATDTCRRMVTQYGMSDDMGPIYLGGNHDEVFLARDYGQQTRAYSEELAARIDAEVQRKMSDALARAKAILTENRDKLDGLSDLLVERETLARAEFDAFMKGEPLPAPEQAAAASAQLREPERVDAPQEV